MNYEDILANELNDVVKAEQEIETLNVKWFVLSKERKIKLLEYYINKKKELKEDMESYYRELKYGKK